MRKSVLDMTNEEFWEWLGDEFLPKERQDEMAIVMRRAKAGENILTLQYVLTDAEVDELREYEGTYEEWLQENKQDEDVSAFIDRPGRGPVVLDLDDDEEVAGPAELKFEAQPAAPQKPAAWYDIAPAAEREDRFAQPEAI